MSLFQCDECGTVENTAYCNYFYEHVYLKGQKLCCVCSKVGCKPRGIWHDRFPRVFLPKDMFITGKTGDLLHKVTGDSDWNKYSIPKPLE